MPAARQPTPPLRNPPRPRRNRPSRHTSFGLTSLLDAPGLAAVYCHLSLRCTFWQNVLLLPIHRLRIMVRVAQIGLDHLIAPSDILWRARCDAPALVQDINSVAGVENHVNIVLDKHYSYAPFSRQR